jgi:ferrous iron transport protein B
LKFFLNNFVDNHKEITIALAGNPNSGKSSVFNSLTGARQKVANFPGVTVEKKIGSRHYAGYDITVIDLPGTYSLSPYSPDEKVARDYLLNTPPDLIINVIDSVNVERSLYLTTQLIEMGIDLILDLNMWDEAIRTGMEIDTERLSALLGTPVIKTVASRSEGIDDLLETIISLHENKEKLHRHPPISYGPKIDDVVTGLAGELTACGQCHGCCNPRWMAVKYLEGDGDITDKCNRDESAGSDLAPKIEKYRHHLTTTTKQSIEMAIAEGRYGYAAGIIKEVVKRPKTDRMKFSEKVDNILTHRYLGYPIFLLIIWLIFQATFFLGGFPARWIESGTAYIQSQIMTLLPVGIFRELITEGIIGGVGAVIVFLPNIMILFLGISILEDTGYMARAAFLMDRVMHFLGLHGKSFIPLLMGFGCNAPAIMATRTLESNRDRILTILITPMISCSARLPVYILFAGTFFGAQSGNIIFSIYLIGIASAILLARILGKTILKADQMPFVMELPPYRRPTTKSAAIHMWERAKIYIKKISGVILIASVILWFLSTFPRYDKSPTLNDPDMTTETVPGNIKGELAHSLLGRLGNVIHPIFAPLGFNHEMTIALLPGFVAKEIVVSTLGVLYRTEDDSESLTDALRSPSSPISKAAAYSFMLFILLYTPCLPTLFAIRREIGSKWMWVSIIMQSLLAWLIAFTFFQFISILF